MSDGIEESQADEGRLELIELLVAAVPEAQREDERRKWKHHFCIVNLVSEAADGKRGLWWPDSSYGVQLHSVDPIEWKEVEKSAEEGSRRCFAQLTGLSTEKVDFKTVVLRMAEMGEDYASLLFLTAPTITPKFLEDLAAAAREGERRRQSLPEDERFFQPGTMRDFASFLLTFRWDRGIRLETIELPPFAFWTDQAIAGFFQHCIKFPAEWQAIRDRRKFYGLKHPKLILVDRIEYERIGGEGEEIEIGDGFRLGYCRKERRRTG